jgi:hypothetical protein
MQDLGAVVANPAGYDDEAAGRLNLERRNFSNLSGSMADGPRWNICACTGMGASYTSGLREHTPMKPMLDRSASSVLTFAPDSSQDALSGFSGADTEANDASTNLFMGVACRKIHSGPSQDDKFRQSSSDARFSARTAGRWILTPSRARIKSEDAMSFFIICF